MNLKENWQVGYENEVERAIAARENGNEGMARVCARRAAGIIIGEYLFRRGYVRLNASAYDRLSIFNSLPDVDRRLNIISTHLLLKVNHDHTLPIEIDLISGVQWLKENLLLENKD